jgi:uncharacterized protein YbgA (DUF1722 family)
VTTKTGIDHTDRMIRWARKRVRELKQENLCGFIFKSDSPSSGMVRVKVYNQKGMPEKKGVGIFARIFMDTFPLIPVEDDGRLHDPGIRENYVEQIFSLKRWRENRSKRSCMGNLVDFHTRNKLLLFSHSEKHMRQMGKLVSSGKSLPCKDLYSQYEELLLAALRLKSTIRKNTNVLMHMVGYFKKQLTADEKQELLEIIRQYREGFVPIIVPITIFNHYVRKYRQPYLAQQTYLNPHPVALKLRNHV